MTFRRLDVNPLLTREDIPDIPPVIRDASSVFNPGVVRTDDGIRFLLRVQTRGRRTYLVPARSEDGVTIEVADRVATFEGLETTGEEIYHLYDPRLSVVEGQGYAVLAADVPEGSLLVTARTDDFENFTVLDAERYEDLRNGVLFPERIGGRYLRLDRPNKDSIKGQPGSGVEVRVAELDDLATWKGVGTAMYGRWRYWDELIGAGPPPLKTDAGWLLVYHGITTHAACGNLYQAGVALLDLEDPTKVIARGIDNVLEPREPWEMIGQVPNVIFPTGLIPMETDGSGFAPPATRVLLYYGAADTVVGVAESTVGELIDAAYEGWELPGEEDR